MIFTRQERSLFNGPDFSASGLDSDASPRSGCDELHLAGEGGGGKSSSGGGDDMDLSSLDADLDMDLSDLEMNLDGDSAAEEAGDGALDISDLALDRPAAAGASGQEEDLPALDTDLDFGDAPEESHGDTFDLDMDLPELDDDLGTPELESQLAQTQASVGDAGEPGASADMDLPDLEDELSGDLAGSVGGADDDFDPSTRDDGLGLPELDAMPEDGLESESIADELDQALPDLDMDLPEFEGDTAGDTAPSASGDDSLDLPDLEMDLPDLDSVSDDLEPTGGASSGDLDLPDLEDLGDDLAAGAPLEADLAGQLGADQEMGDTMTMDMEGVVEPEASAESGDLELDMGDLETLDDAGPAEEGESTGDLELELGDMDGAEELGTPSAEAEDPLGDLELDMGGAESPGDGLGLDSLDVTEELMVPDAEEESASDLQEDFDLELPELSAEEEAGEPQAPGSDLDLGDLEDEPEQALEMTDEEATAEMAIDLDSFELTMDSSEPQPSTPSGDDGMELDFDMELDGDSSESDGGGMDLDIDLEGEIASGGVEGGGLEVEVMDEDEQDVEIDEATDDFHVDAPLGDAIQTMELSPEQAAETFDMGAGDTMEMAPETMEMDPSDMEDAGPPPLPPEAGEEEAPSGKKAKKAKKTKAPKKPKEKKGGPSVVLVLLLLLLLVVGGGYAAMQFLGVQIPFVSEFLGMAEPGPAPAPAPAQPAPKPAAPAAAPAPAPVPVKKPGGVVSEITLSPPEYQWVETPGGWALVVTGKAQNGFNSPCSHIRVKGILKDANGAVLSMVYAYGGNPMSTAQVASVPRDAVNKAMNTKTGAGGANVNVPAGAWVDYTVVFFNPPDSLDAVDVQAIGADPAG